MSVTVVGFDVGNSTCFIAVAKGGGIETIDNEYSDRCTPTYVSFGPKNRFMGAAAKQQAITNIKNTVFNFPRFLGKKFSDPCIQQEIARVPFVVKALPGDRIGFEFQYMNEQVTLTPEQVMASQLTKLKSITETHLNAPCIDVVINVPSFYSDAERRAVLEAASIAGLNCVRLLNDTTACGIAYGLYNKDFPESDKPPRIVSFFMMGESNLQVAICAFNNGKMKVLATSSVHDLGGRDLDYAIYAHMCSDISSRYKLDVAKNPKATVRLLQECEKLKKLMSANSTKIPLNIECFMEDKDISCSMQRSDFETLISNHLQKVEKCMQDCLALAKLTPKDVAFVELVGGSTRIPAIKALVLKVFQQEGRTTLNSDEAVARGCALQAAICSPAFKVREFSVIDACAHSIQLICEGEAEAYEVEIFPRLHPVPSSRQIDLKRRTDFAVEAIENSETKSTSIGRYMIRGVRPSEGAEMAKLQLKARMTRYGIFNISQAQLVEQHKKEVEVELTPEEIAATQKDGQEQQPEQPMEVEANGNGEPAQPAAPVEKPKKMVTKLCNKYIDLKVDVEGIFHLTEKDLNVCKERENEMVQQDRLERDRSNAKNALEEYIYEMRDKLGSVLEPFVPEAEREAFSAELTRMEDWLYDEGEDLPKQPYVDKLQSLKNVGDKYLMRHREAEQRPIAMDRLAHAVVHVEKAVAAYQAKDEKYSHLTQEEMTKVQIALNEKRTWYEERSNAFKTRSPYENPDVYAFEILQQADALENSTNPILLKPKPVVKPPPTAADTSKSNGHAKEDGTTSPGEEACGNNNNMETDEQSGKGSKVKSTGEAECMDLD